MSRMLGYVLREPAGVECVRDIVNRFWPLARLHSDGWGTAWVSDGAVSVEGGTARLTSPPPAVSGPADARIVYLRFASSGAPALPENVQPFLRGSAAFQHNGSISPRHALTALLTADEIAGLRGDTDSEPYAVLVGRAAGAEMRPAQTLTAIAQAVSKVRSIAPDACLNALWLRPEGLYVVQSSGSRPAPVAAFAARGWVEEGLPPGHDDISYNRMNVTRLASGDIVVASSGFEQDGWAALPDDTVTLFPLAGESLTSPILTEKS